MLKLLSYMPNNNSILEFQKNKTILEDLNIHGIETILGDYCEENIFSELPIKGVHFIYFPTWLDLWQNNKKNLLEDFQSETPYGIKDKNELISIFKEQLNLAKKQSPHYIVFHVSHVRPSDIYTFEFEYTDSEILEASLEIINEVFIEEGPLLLFENLPWPGFNLNNYELTKHFFQRVNYKNKGIMLDLSHLMCLNKEIENFDEGIDYIENIILKMKDLKNYIYGVHLNGALSKKYLSNDFFPLQKKWKESSQIDRYHIEIAHIKNIDTHSVFESKKLKNFLNSLNLKFLVYELSYKTLEDLLTQAKFQDSFLNDI